MHRQTGTIILASSFRDTLFGFSMAAGAPRGSTGDGVSAADLACQSLSPSLGQAQLHVRQRTKSNANLQWRMATYEV